MFSMAGEIGPRIKQARESYREVGMKQNALAQLLGISAARLSNWERGLNDPDGGLVARIAKALDVSAKWLLTGEVPTEETKPATMMRTIPLPTGKLRLLNAASAGPGNANAIDEYEVEVPAQLCRDDYGALYVEGDSMLPLLRNGDVAVFQETCDARQGQIIAATIGEDGNEDWLIKVVTREKDGVLALSPLNTDYSTIIGSFTVHGRLVGIYRVEGPEHTVRFNPLGLKAA